MISFLFLFFFFTLLIKDFFFGKFLLDENLVFLISLFPLVFLIINFSGFSISFLEEKMFSLATFFLILFFLGLSFVSFSSFSFLLFLESCVLLMMIFIFRFSKDQDKISSTLFMFFFNSAPSILFMYFAF